MSRIKDIVGQRFGNLIVLKDTGLRENRKVVWECECDCGCIFTVRSSRLHDGTVTCCPTCAKAKFRIDLANQRFGKLTVLEPMQKRTKSGLVIWRCRCDCGNEIELDSRTIRRNVNLACKECLSENFLGNKRTKNLAGQRFGKLTALSVIGKNEKNVNLWECQCDCGNRHIVPTNSLTMGCVQSCGKCTVSKGEQKIKEILLSNNIKFEQQKTFDSCRFPETNSLLRFDFYLPDYNLLIEYDGIQHFTYEENSAWLTKEKYERTKVRDVFKDNWASENNIKLKRISYLQFKDMDLDLLLE